MSDGASKIPKWVWITTPTLAVAFIGFILFLSTVPAGQELSAVQGDARKMLQQGMDKAKEKAAEDIPKPNYEFYKLLENQTVEVPEVEEYKSTPKNAAAKYEYRLQAGSFRSESDAERLRGQLILQGLEAYREEREVSGNVWHRIMVGPFNNRSKMNKAQDILAANNISPVVHKAKLEN
ncbi:SPOR domain-containing protein [Bacterioplanoides sp. SCSIO 12839]|uniref:SPOR domain-containing protein n=1 Tax=Bacterioplanoides sp. SCSIO 12839 TaxID=2829569 RepID=UPI002103D7CA|nr:SPOR domain-containing protein [Bacterioplanoides sp. SCSIO 12839]UTW47910.1 SPOR domain-containing protein [Bacterioplanoides sp. SCSIO 12839]